MSEFEQLTICMVEDVPDEPQADVFYIEGTETRPSFGTFACPCGCDELIVLNFIGGRPRWEIRRFTDENFSISPSVHRTVGCRSHFHIRDGRIHWCERPGRVSVFDAQTDAALSQEYDIDVFWSQLGATKSDPIPSNSEQKLAEKIPCSIDDSGNSLHTNVFYADSVHVECPDGFGTDMKPQMSDCMAALKATEVGLIYVQSFGDSNYGAAPQTDASAITESQGKGNSNE